MNLQYFPKEIFPILFLILRKMALLLLYYTIYCAIKQINIKHKFNTFEFQF